MNAQNKRAVVEKAYADFDRRDIPGILAALSPEIELQDAGTPYVPYAGTYRGPDGSGSSSQSSTGHWRCWSSSLGTSSSRGTKS